MNRRLSIVIPCLNEEKAIDQVLTRIYATRSALYAVGVSDLEVIVVDDLSNDASSTLLQKWKSSHGLIAIHNSKRLNYGGSLKAGFAIASGDLIGFMDMDGTYPPEAYPTMIQALDREQAEIVCGTRLSHHSGMPWIRSIGNRFYVAIITLLYGQGTHDCCTGQRVFLRELKQEFCEIPASHLNFSLFMTLQCLISRRRIFEMPIQYDERIGASKLSVMMDGPRFLFTILKVYLSRNTVIREAATALSE